MVHNSIKPAAPAMRQVHEARQFHDFEDIKAGTIVVLDPALSSRIRDYRFDIALTSTPHPTAVLTHPGQWTEPSMTSQRIAENNQIALGELRPGQTAVSLAVTIHDRVTMKIGGRVRSLQQVHHAIESCMDVNSIDGLLETCSRHLQVTLSMLEKPTTEQATPIRVQGIARSFIEFDGPETNDVVRPAVAYIARHIEKLLQAEYDVHELPDVTRSELLNDILLSDPATSAESTGRLRNADFPIDGSHYAIRIDCHDPLPNQPSAQIVSRCQQRISEVILDHLRGLSGVWNRAGTSNSILLVSSLRRAHGELITDRPTKAVADAMSQLNTVYPGIRLYVGAGTPHLGAAGLRTSVSEATTAVRLAKARDQANELQHFDRLGLGRALVRWAEVDGVRPVVDEIMAPILNQTPRQAREALSTLRAYLNSGQSVARTAETLHLHRNTVRYRLERIATLLPIDMDNPDERLLLDLSCRIVDAELF